MIAKLMNLSVNNKAVCRTAPATPGLLIMPLILKVSTLCFGTAFILSLSVNCKQTWWVPLPPPGVCVMRVYKTPPEIYHGNKTPAGDEKGGEGSVLL